MQIEKIGFVQAMQGDELWVNTLSDERILLTVHDEQIRHALYCKYVKITVEQISKDEYCDAANLSEEERAKL